MKYVKKRDKDGKRERVATFEWPNKWDDKVEVDIVCTGRKLVRKAREEATDKGRPKYDNKHRKIENVDDDKWNARLTYHSIKDIRGLKVKHLPEILDPNEVEFSFKPEDAEKPFPFEGESKEMICDCSTMFFQNWIGEQAQDYAAFVDEVKEAEAGNSVTPPNDGADKPAAIKEV